MLFRSLLGSLERGIRSAQLAEANARLADAEIGAANAADLAARGFGPETAVVAKQAGLQSAQAGVLQIKQEISRLEILAPFRSEERRVGQECRSRGSPRH